MAEKEYKNAESTLRSESNMYNQGTKNAQLIHEILNSSMNWFPIVEKIKNGKARDISDEPKVTNKNCFILGSGPSLDESIEYLKDWEGGIICTPSHALTLMYYKIEPTHILILDPFEKWDDLKGIDWSKTRTKLITHPGCYPDLIENWPNEILLYLENSGRTDAFYQDEQRKMYSWRSGDFRQSMFTFYIRTSLTIFACSPPMQLFAGEVLGYEKFFLAGCDFAYPSNKQRFTNYTIDLNQFSKEILWHKNEHILNLENHNLVKSNNGFLTEPMHLYYLKNLISAWRLCHKTIYTTDHGAMTQVPYHDIKAVIKKQGDFPIQQKFFIDDICDTYLASTGAYVIETDKGNSFVESMNAEKELPIFMQNVMSKYYCNSCKVNLTIPTTLFKLSYEDNNEQFNDVPTLMQKYFELKSKRKTIPEISVINNPVESNEGETCPACKNGKLFKEVHIDIEANMNRIKKSIEKANRLYASEL